ncbi:short-chain dehydrogenase, partial [Kibdelosporangium philippinense]
TRRYTPLAAYAQAMLALTLFTKALADRGFTAVSVDPGTTDREVLRLYGSDAGPSHDAVEAVVRLCAPGFGVLNGAFYEGMLPAPMITDDRAVARLWRLSERLTNLG